MEEENDFEGRLAAGCDPNGETHFEEQKWRRRSAVDG